MKRDIGALAVTATLLLWYSAGDPAFAQKQGGILRVPHFDSPASMSLHEESTIAANRPLIGVFNNLVMFDQHVAQNSPRSIVPELATSWSWNEEGTELTLPLRQGVRWHDGKPFTARDVKCTWDLLVAKSSEKLRIDPGKAWYDNLDEVTANSDFEVTFHLKRAQPSFLAMLASGWSAVYPCHIHAREMRQHPIATGPFKLPCRHEIFHFHLERPQPAFVALLASGYSVVYPCHVPPNEMRQHPIGTGPFKFVEFRPNERITLTRNRDYWKSDRPYLDGIEFTIIRDVSTAHLAFVAGKLDWIATSIPLLRDVRTQAPDAICEVLPGGISRNLIFNRDAPPFDNADMRRAMALALDRKAFIT
jgi:peptide/nickel transport system substrate-binding protein